MARTVQAGDTITVGALAEKLEIPVSKLIGELMKQGVLATVNERIDYDTAEIIVGEMGLDVSLERETSDQTPKPIKKKPKGEGEQRPPVIAVMGHVDHGKTSLLDAIAGSKVVAQESGGITQHISARQIDHAGKKITFLDTPGHEAFAALREHGAYLTDIAIIVVAGDDGVKPQTIEAIRFARKADARIIVAINKMDKPEADVNRVKTELAEKTKVLVEGWGGDTVAVELSAKTGDGIDKLLDMINLVSEMEELKAKSSGPAEGLIIEAHMEKGKGPLGVALVESGQLKKGDLLVAGATWGKVRSLELVGGKKLDSAGPSTPVEITGFKALPRFGDRFSIARSEKEARVSAAATSKKLSQAGMGLSINSSDLIRLIDRKKKLQELNVIVKADVQGSLKSVIDSLRTLETEEVKVRLVGSGIGNITEKDVHLASTSGSVIYGFNISASSSIKQLASRDNVPLKMFDVIYELIDDVKAELEKLLPDDIIKTDLGRLLVKGVFKITKNDVICGGEVTKGKLGVPALANIYRGDDTVAENVEVLSLKKGPTETAEVQTGQMCGVNFKTAKRVEVKEGDRIEFFTVETKARKL